MVKRLSRTKASPEVPVITDPKTADEFAQRGWNHYTKKEYFRAENDFHKALELTPDNPDFAYGLALTLQASGRTQEAITQFEKLIQIYKSPAEGDEVRALMVIKLAQGHINRIKTGNWHIND